MTRSAGQLSVAAVPQLFLVVLGGRTATSHIELHDVRFVAGASIDDTIQELRRQWFGRRGGCTWTVSWRCGRLMVGR